MKSRVRKAGDLAARIQGQLRRGWGHLPFLAAWPEREQQLFTATADRIELLQSKADRIDQLMAACADIALQVHAQPVSIGLRLRGRNGRQIAVGPGGGSGMCW